MDYGGGAAYPGSNAIAIIPDASGPPDSWPPGGNDQPMWATDEDYRSWSGDPSADAASNSAYDGRLSRSRAGSEQPPGKKGRNSQADAQGGNRTTTSKAIGKMFFKTKLCCKFRAGTCPYITNCNFAHGIEELRRPPPNWQEIVAAQEEGSSEPREERRIPTMNSSVVAGESERSYKGRRCKKFYTEEGCPYGDSCTFIHDEQSKARESVTISLSPMVGGSGLGGGANTPTQKPSNWKTRTCHKWEMTGYCPFGNKCHFAHGAAELHRYGGGPVETEGRDASLVVSDSKHGGVHTKFPPSDASVASNSSVPHADMYHIGVPSQRSAGVVQRQGQRSVGKWKGPDKISKIYGDWIDDIE
ncbi:zinc finger CCCH domain-containing protein 56-like isoform X1 [Musa acuminata AAA Group]|uniref:zinc finger CCCH domain-containing protein 56-like isoform X1 n=1 Tax=Musa acuminata AAA Group TaxID=214697 RepID=UPI0031D1EE98